MKYEGTREIIRALTDSACPSLRRLSLCRMGRGLSYGGRSPDYDPVGIGQALAEAFESGNCRHLQELTVHSTELGHEGAIAMIRAMKGGACPEIVKLSLGLSSAAHVRALGQALRSMACPKLQILSFCNSFYHEHDHELEEGRVVIFEAIEAGCCPNIKELNFNYVRYGHLRSHCICSCANLW